MQIPANLQPGAFAGAAEAYARYRPSYPRPMLDDLLARAAVGRGALLDLATGPGRVALDLAGSFERVVAIDLEPEMIAVARARAVERGIDNVEWHVGRAEDLDAQPGSFDLVTIGEAFHRLQQRVVATNALRWLRPGGCVATLGTDGRFTGNEPWEIALRDVRERWVARAFPDGWGEALPGGSADQEGREAALRAAGFVDITGNGREDRVDLSFEEVLGYLSSTSICSRTALGEHFEAFAAELAAELGADGTTTFRETIRWGYTLARKPG
jgi:SAM-dependent methyltransferase